MGGQEVGTHLGPRRVRGAGLVGRLAAPRSRLACSTAGPQAEHGKAYDAARRRAAGRAARSGCKSETAHQHLRPGHRRPDRLGRPRRGDRRPSAAHYAALFGDDPALHELRKAYAIPANTHQDPERQRADERLLLLGRLGLRHRTARAQTITYTNNWPPEALIDNQPDAARSSSGRSSASCCCWPASARWPGTSPSQRHKRRATSRDVPATRSAAGAAAHALDAGDAEVLLGRGRADRGADRPGRGHRPLRRRGRRLLRHSRWPSGCPTPWPAPGTRSSASSGSPPPGWPRACSSPRPSPATSRSSSARA